MSRPDDPEETSYPSDGRLDEVGIAVGPDRDALGLFDSPLTEGTATSEHTAAAVEVASAPDQRRTAVLAWIASQPHEPADPSRADAPSAAIKRLIADEPMDRLPALDGLAPRARPVTRGRAALAPEREDTATQIEGLDAVLRPLADDPPEAPPRRLPGPIPILVAAVLALVAAWILLRLAP